MLDKDRQIHMVGIGGAGMSSIAEILLNLGYQVSGSDLEKTVITERLRRRGARISYGHGRENIPRRAGLLVVSAAIEEENVEVQEAKAKSIPIISRGEMLADLMRMKRYAVAVAGTHGKTTTTSMISAIFEEADLESTVIVGGILNRTGSSAKWGKGDYLVAETDEHDGSFLKLSPTVAVVTNIDKEHLEHYGSFDGLMKAFVDFIRRVPFYGFAVGCIDDDNLRSLLPSVETTFITYGIDRKADINASDIRVRGELGEAVTDLKLINRHPLLGKTGELGRVEVKVFGLHNVRNLLAAVAVGLGLSIDFTTIRKGLANFKGVRRRLQLKGKIGGITVVEDYAHHPTEIRAVMEAVRPFVQGRILIVFQPHLYSRTKLHRKAFGEVLSSSDFLIVTDIYPAREKPLEGVSSQGIVEAAREKGHREAYYLPRREDAVAPIIEFARPGDLILILGAGNIYTVTEAIVKRLCSSG